MKHIENRLIQAGFRPLQEKESFIYYEKTISTDADTTAQICLVYDVVNRHIQSVDTYIALNGRMEWVNNGALKQEIHALLTS